MFANMRFSRFERVCHALNTDLALQVINRSTYNSETMKQGSCDIQEQNLPSVSVKSGTSVDLIFDFTAAWNGYKHAEPVGIFYITVLDLEQGMAIEASNYTSYSLGFNSSIEVKSSETYKARFVSGKKGPVGEKTLGDAEGRPRNMTPDQKKIAVSFQFKNLARFYMKFEVAADSGVAARQFRFTGNTSVSNIKIKPRLLQAQSTNLFVPPILPDKDEGHGSSSVIEDSVLSDAGQTAPHTKEVEHAMPDTLEVDSELGVAYAGAIESLIEYADNNAGREKKNSRGVVRSERRS